MMAPYVLRFRHVLDPRQCALVRRHILDAVTYFDDTDAKGRTRVGARALIGVLRPRYRMQNERQLSLYFPEPPPVLDELYQKVGKLLAVHPSNIEAIYHLYAPGALPANIHMDNFNKFLFPHRYASVSMFFDDNEDGGTVFPLVNMGPPPPRGEMSVAWEGWEVEDWHRLINETRMQVDDDGFAFRRVDRDDANDFRRRALSQAVAMCRSGRAAQGPVVPEMGTAYMWRNYKSNGEDDVLTIHAGCGAQKAFKIIGTFFIRDWPGPFQEHSTFWDPRDQRDNLIDELQRQVEVHMLQSFRLNHIDRLYAQQRGIMKTLQGKRAADWLHRRQHAHLLSLGSDNVDLNTNADILHLTEQYGQKELRWSKVAHANGIF